MQDVKIKKTVPSLDCECPTAVCLAGIKGRWEKEFPITLSLPLPLQGGGDYKVTVARTTGSYNSFKQNDEKTGRQNCSPLDKIVGTI
jgi:hypothetical protein